MEVERSMVARAGSSANYQNCARGLHPVTFDV